MSAEPVVSSGALMLIDDAHAEQVLTYAKGLDQRLVLIRALPKIDDATEAVRRHDMNVEAKRADKQLEETRKKATEPLLRDKRLIDALFASVQEPLRQCSALLDRQLNAWEAQERARIQRETEEANRRAAEAAEREAEAMKAGDLKAAEAASQEQTVALLAAPAVEAPKGIKSQAGTSFTRPKLNFTIASADLVPRNYCSPDAAKIRVAVLAGVTVIPGVAIFEETLRTTRTR